ncbi:glucose PTS transporter subunit EIIB [Pseudarthrobacter sp. NPDC092439]|uniref:glucose PTS transporter subunit EIIB n=2 Tax=Micrococcales TaxID=85006 RepID=UPI003816DAA0
MKRPFKPVLSGYDQFSVIHPTSACQEGILGRPRGGDAPGGGPAGGGAPSLVAPGPPDSDRQGVPDQAPAERAVMSKAEKIIEGLGGAGNIVEVEACITRLRTEVKDGSLVNEATLKAAGAHGVLAAGTAVQVIVGPEADTLAEDIEDLL